MTPKIKDSSFEGEESVEEPSESDHLATLRTLVSTILDNIRASFIQSLVSPQGGKRKHPHPFPDDGAELDKTRWSLNIAPPISRRLCSGRVLLEVRSCLACEIWNLLGGQLSLSRKEVVLPPCADLGWRGQIPRFQH